MRQFPVLVGFGLSVEDLRLVEALARTVPLRTVQGNDPRALASGLNLVEEGSISLLNDLAGWGLPVIVLAGAQAPAHLSSAVRQAGVAGFFQMPGPHDPVTFPPLELPPRTGSAILLVEDKPLRSMYRQVLCFAGYDARTDLMAPEDVTSAVRDCGSRGQPCLAVIDVDMEGANIRLLLRQLRDLFAAVPQLRKTAVLVLKDFERPGFDPRLLSSDIRPLTRRVFHPEEGLLALLEGLVLPPLDLRLERDSVDLPQVLNQERSLLLESPAPAIRNVALASAAFSRALPFLWLYELASMDSRKGVVLADVSRD
ncbi:MAG: hypothetical protein HY042_07980 [Spirochaetia bacterium]|nr:hypothetical protein [Spirochaetia bacterium]